MSLQDSLFENLSRWERIKLFLKKLRKQWDLFRRGR